MADTRRRGWAPSLTVGLVMAGLLVLTAILAPIFLSTAADQLSSDSRQGPSAEHWLGTDQFGRDILARSLVATRLTLVMSLSATALSAVAGVFIGGMIWLAPRWLRETVLRIIDSTVAFPALILALVIAAILGPGSGSAIVAIGVAGIPSFARITSNMTASVVNRDYVTTARLLGVPAFRVFSRHLLPNISGPLLVLVASSFALSLLEISSLSFVGLGVQSPEYDYGRLLNEGLPSIYNQPLQVLVPSLLLIYAGITAMLIGDGLATTIDPRFRRRTRRVRATASPVAAAAPAPTALVEVDNLTVSTSTGQQLVKGISFTIDDGEIVGLVGESGSGKSMTAMALAGLLSDGVTASAATLRLGDMDLTRRNPAKRLATEIGLVYQDPGTTFNPALRIGTQLTEVARVHLRMGRRDAERTLIGSLDRVRIRDSARRMTQHPHQLSGGMLQRAVIASSIVTDPRLLIADEPTTALDVTVQADVLRQFRAINRAQGTATLFISHDFGVVKALCDRVLVMRDGEIIERLTGDQLGRGEVQHPYTKELLAATPTLEVAPAVTAAADTAPADTAPEGETVER